MKFFDGFFVDIARLVMDQMGSTDADVGYPCTYLYGSCCHVNGNGPYLIAYKSFHMTC